MLVIPACCDDDPFCPCDDCCDSGGSANYTECIERDFAVSAAVTVTVNNFVGDVTYRTGSAGCVRVKAVKRAEHRSELDCIEVHMTAHSTGVDVTTSNPRNLDNASVDLEITAPADAIPNIYTGVGEIYYRARPLGNCRFKTGVGQIRLALPSDVSVTVELSAGVGTIFVGFPVDGVITNHPSYVKGTIGGGCCGDLYACTGVGNISLLRR